MRRFFRIWLWSREDAKRLEIELPRLLASRTRKLRGAWYDLNAEVSLQDLRADIEKLADNLGLLVMDDDGVIEILSEPVGSVGNNHQLVPLVKSA